MIGRNVQMFCCEDISLIENYDKAINDNTQMYECHHRNEIILNKYVEELIVEDLYFNRPASELIFLTKQEHRKIHTGFIRHKLSGKAKELVDNRIKNYGNGRSFRNKMLNKEYWSKVV